MATATRTLSTPQQARQRPKLNVIAIGRSTFKEFQQDDCTGLAAESAYHILFAIFPLAIFSASMSAIINNAFGLDLFGRIMSALTTQLPADAASAIQEPLKQVLSNENGGLLSIGILLALWSGSNAMSTMIKALNRAYDVEETRPIWKAKGLQVVLTLFMGIFAATAFILIVFGGKIGDKISRSIGTGHAFTFVWNLLRWPMVIAFISLALAVLYWAGPNVDQEFKWLSPGAILATIVWVIAIGAFGLYVSHFGSYNKTYGTLGGVIVLMLVFYYSSAIILFGGELNSELAKRYDPDTINDLARHPEKDKGEQIYSDKAPKKLPSERETDLKGAEVRGEDLNGPVAAPTANIVPGPRRDQRQRAVEGKLVNYASGKREVPTEDPNAAYRMTADPASRPNSAQKPPSKRAAITLGLMGISAIGMAAKKLKGS